MSSSDKTYDVANQNSTTTTPEPTATTNSTTRDEVQFGLKNTFLDNRLLLDVGGNIDISRQNKNTTNTTAQSGTYFGWNFTAEYLFTADGRFRIRAYARPEPTFQNFNSTRVGTGIQYRYEYDSLEDFKNGFKREVVNGNVECHCSSHTTYATVCISWRNRNGCNNRCSIYTQSFNLSSYM